jgi:hypothetical protein
MKRSGEIVKNVMPAAGGRFLKFAALLLFVMSVTLMTSAQQTTATIVGNVTDSTDHTLLAVNATMNQDPDLLTASVEKIRLEDAELKANWGNAVFRIQLKTSGAKISGRLKVTVSSR